MRLGVLFSGGKDSTYALYKAMKANDDNDAICLISVISKNPESYMFHTPNIHLVELQAKAIGLPLVKKETTGVKEEELDDLKQALAEAKKNHKIQGVVTGAVESVYQSLRIKKLCDELGLECFNPLWKKDQEELLREIVKHRFKVIISGVFAYPLGKEWVGREINDEVINELVALRQKYSISPAGEGGELETTVLDAPFFKKKINIVESDVAGESNSFVFRIKRAELIEK